MILIYYNVIIIRLMILFIPCGKLAFSPINLFPSINLVVFVVILYLTRFFSFQKMLCLECAKLSRLPKLTPANTTIKREDRIMIIKINSLENY